MKKNILLSMMILASLISCPFVNANQAEQTSADNIAVISVQKQPTNKEQKQAITKNIGCIILQINGKAVNYQQKETDNK